MFKNFYPYEYVKSVFDIDYKKLHNIGIRGLIFDIDNTLVHHGDDASSRVIHLFKKIHNIGLKTVLLSNNDEERVSRFVKNINTPYVCDAEKPASHGYKKALSILGTSEKETVVIGDQMFVDIIGANRCDIPSILVHYISAPNEKWIGFKRYIEMAVLALFKRDKRYNNRFGCAIIKETSEKETPKKKRKLFCEICPLTYAISVRKNILIRHIKNMISDEIFAKSRSKRKLPCLISSCSSHLIKKGKGIDPVTQLNKAKNIQLACKSINGIVIRPGETFSFWNRVGKTSAAKGYKEGRVIILGKLTKGLGGGLCNLANTINRAVIQSPLTVTEFNIHSDALAPDENGIRIPLSAGTSVNYNYEDYRFRNDTTENIQLLAWCDDEKLYCEIRSQKLFPNRYEISEEDHHFSCENGTYFRISKIYKDTYNKQTNELIEHKLILDNHSEVLFDPSLIPLELIR